MAKQKRKFKTSDYFIGGIIVIIIALLTYTLFIVNPENPGAVDIGTEIPAEADANGLCTAREGIEMGLCCAVWNSELGDLEWVICENYVADNMQENVQAFFRFDNAPDQLENQAVINYVMRVGNTGNTAAEVRISNVVTTSTSGHSASEQEFTDAFESFGNDWTYVPRNNFVDYSMSCPNVIRLDLPLTSSSCGVNAFVMEDGTYTTTITIEFRDPITKEIVGTETRTVSQEVTQEVISFNIEITA